MNTTTANTAPLDISDEATDLYPFRTVITLNSTTSHMDDVLGVVTWNDSARVNVSTLGHLQLSVNGYGSANYKPMPGMSGANSHAVAGMTPAEARALAITLLKAADAADALTD